MVDVQQVKKDLREDLNMSNLPDDVQAEIVDMVSQNVIEKVVLETVKRIPKEKRGAFNSLRSPQDIQNFINEHISNYDEFVRDVIQKEVSIFKQEAGLS